MVHSELFQNKYVVSNQSSLVLLHPHPHSENCSFCMFSLFNFSSIFPGGSADPFCPYVRMPMAIIQLCNIFLTSLLLMCQLMETFRNSAFCSCVVSRFQLCILSSDIFTLMVVLSGTPVHAAFSFICQIFTFYKDSKPCSTWVLFHCSLQYLCHRYYISFLIFSV